jgi:YbgC/YbaW family acyl-CoA thioester hydrolase
MVFKFDIPVRWVDTDALRVVHYSNYFRYAEAAEEELYRSLGFTFKELNEVQDCRLANRSILQIHVASQIRRHADSHATIGRKDG